MTGTTASGPETTVRLYGGWRRTRGVGLWGLSPTASVVALACLLVPLLLSSVSLRWGLAAAAPAALVAVLTVTRIGGRSLGALAQRRTRWVLGSLTGRRSGRHAAHDLVGTVRWPAPLDGLRVLEVAGGRGGVFGVVHDPASGHLSATLRCAASSTWLVDRSDADGWVGTWHTWLAALGYLPAVRWVAVTVDTAPEPGTKLREEVLARLDPRAPADARALLRELVERSPGAAADVQTRVTITFDPAPGARRRAPLPVRLDEVARLLAGLESSLSGCGVTVLGRAGVGDLARTVREAFDPASRQDRSTADGREPLGWDESSPVAVEEGWGSYRHDSGTSVTLGWQEAPRAQVTSDVLVRLLSPGRHPRRVTLLYRSLPAGQAARILEGQVNAAAFRDAYRRAQRRDETARDVADRDQARRAAQEEALGAGVVLLSLYVTVTTLDPAHLQAAVADVTARADQSRIRLRPLYGGQAAGFATTLPLGLHPAQLARRGRAG